MTRSSEKIKHAMSDLAAENRKDVEVQVLHALLPNASPDHKTHAKQKEAAALLEPLDRAYLQHPGIPHYLIHAFDSKRLTNTPVPGDVPVLKWLDDYRKEVGSAQATYARRGS